MPCIYGCMLCVEKVKTCINSKDSIYLSEEEGWFTYKLFIFKKIQRNSGKNLNLTNLCNEKTFSIEVIYDIKNYRNWGHFINFY